ncbi:MAG TPA: hypothetical protein VM223_06960 [Planctomycetota bacterium]|nr:hypothetical protein [Planctomycetota bacterium]
MRTSLTLAVVLMASIVVAGERPGRQLPLPKDSPPEFSSLQETLIDLKLSDEELAGIRELGPKYETMLAEEVTKAKAAVRDKLTQEIRSALSDDHKAQFDLVLAAVEKRDAATTAADRQLADALRPLGLTELKGVRAERDLIVRLIEKTDEGKAGVRAIKAKYEKIRNDNVAQLPLPDPDDRNSKASYDESKARFQHAADAQALEELRMTLTEEARAALSKATEAFREWARATQTAKDEYQKAVQPQAPQKQKNQPRK